MFALTTRVHPNIQMKHEHVGVHASKQLYVAAVHLICPISDFFLDRDHRTWRVKTLIWYKWASPFLLRLVCIMTSSASYAGFLCPIFFSRSKKPLALTFVYVSVTLSFVEYVHGELFATPLPGEVCVNDSNTLIALDAPPKATALPVVPCAPTPNGMHLTPLAQDPLQYIFRREQNADFRELLGPIVNCRPACPFHPRFVRVIDGVALRLQ